MLEIIVKKLLLCMLKHNGDITQGGVQYAYTSDIECSILCELLAEAGYTPVCEMAPAKYPVGFYEGRSCDTYTALKFTTDDREFIRTLKELGFKRTADGMKYSIG